MTTYTTLPVSRLIASKVPEVETGSAYMYNPASDTWIAVTGWSKEDCDGVPRYRLDDAIRAIESLDRTGWSDLWVDTKQHELLTAYTISGCNMTDPRVEEVLISIFK